MLEYLTQIPCNTLKGVGPALYEKLMRCGIYTLQDLLFHWPLRYEDHTKITPIKHTQIGESYLIQGEIIACEVRFKPRKQLICLVSDQSSTIEIRFFHFTHYQAKHLQNIGGFIRCFGEIKYSHQGKLLFHPEYTFIENLDSQTGLPKHLSPIYPSTAGLSQRCLQKLISQAFTYLETQGACTEVLPETYIKTQRYPDIKTAIKQLHYLPSIKEKCDLEQGALPAKKRLIMEELIAYQITLLDLKKTGKTQTAIQIPPAIPTRFQACLQNAGFTLTEDQSIVYQEILQDLAQAHPMRRLLQGDVGSGKTIVAILSILACIDAGYQACFMAPTEILAEQHFSQCEKYFKNMGIRNVCLTGKVTGKQKQKILMEIAAQDYDLIIGTHAIFQENVKFKHLGFIVIDEQHRFGVTQRLSLAQKKADNNSCPHQLLMSATPIPRTLAMIRFADLDISTIKQLPAGRKPIKTIAIDTSRETELVDKIKNLSQAQTQLYWICPLIETNENINCSAAEEKIISLQKKLPHYRIALLHGQMPSAEKNQVMQDFHAGHIQILVATTVIEVGVNVPQASIMIIENAERLGLSQLHQLRGRVGRGEIESYCILLYQAPLSDIAKQRLQLLRKNNDGFTLAEQDLQLRGKGDLLGTKQSGDSRFKIASLERDIAYLESAQALAKKLLQENPQNAKLLQSRWLCRDESYEQVL